MILRRKTALHIAITATLLASLMYGRDIAATENDTSPANNGFIIIGPAITPEYSGSDDYTAVPMIVSQFRFGNIDIEVEGLDAQATLFHYKGWDIGVNTSIDTGRDDDVDNDIIALMNEIDTAVNIGIFLAYQRDSYFLHRDELAFTVNTYSDTSDTHNGTFITTALSYTLPLYIPWRFEFEVETTYISDSYADTYFGVSASDAISSRLSRYSPESGFRDVTLSTNIGLFFNPTWGIFARISASRLLGDAADSPIIDSGDKNQYFFGLGAYYRFGQ